MATIAHRMSLLSSGSFDRVVVLLEMPEHYTKLLE
jgi:hypothetical protein